MGGRLVQAGSAFSAFVAVALVVYGGHRVVTGAASVEGAVAFALLAVAVVTSYRAVAVQSGPRVNAVGNAVLLLGGASAYVGGLQTSLGVAATAGQALFALGCAYFVLRLS